MYSITTAVRKIAALNKRLRIIQGGTSAGKTIGTLEVLIDKAQRDTKPTITSIVSESFPHLKRGAMRDFVDILEEQNYFDPQRWNKTDSTYIFETGSIIEFFSADQPSKVRGPRRQRLFLNEANNLPFETFEQLEIRTTADIYIDYNPTTEFWVHDQIIGKRDDYDFIILTYLDNEALSPQIVKAIEQRKNRPEWWKVYGLGQLGEVEGRIYTGWQIIDTIPHEARLERHGLDFGFDPDPAAIVDVYYFNGGYIFDQVLYQRGLHNSDLASAIKNLPSRLTIADCAEPKSISEISEYQVSIVPCVKGKDSKKYGIGVIQDQAVSVTKSSIDLIKEYRNYLWAVDKEGRVIVGETEGDDHALDAARYAMVSLVPMIRQKEMRDRLPRYEQKAVKNPAR